MAGFASASHGPNDLRAEGHEPVAVEHLVVLDQRLPKGIQRKGGGVDQLVLDHIDAALERRDAAKSLLPAELLELEASCSR